MKCDERPGGCSNCERLQLKCPGNELEQLVSVEELKLPPQAGAKRNKTYRSCGQCRASKTRCSGERPICSRCKRKKQDCSYDSNPDPAWARAVFRDSANWNTSGAANEDEAAEQLTHLNDDQFRPNTGQEAATRFGYDPRLGDGSDSIEWYELLPHAPECE